MEKGSAPPMQQAQYQQGMPEAPPSYEQSIGPGAGGGFMPPHQQQKMGIPPPANYGQPMQPPGVPMQPGVPVQQIVQVQYVQAPNFGYRPVNMTCPHCQNHVTTTTDSEPSAMAWIVGAVLCFVGLWCFSCIPCCIDSMQSVTHKCPSCKNFLGRYKGSGL